MNILRMLVLILMSIGSIVPLSASSAALPMPSQVYPTGADCISVAEVNVRYKSNVRLYDYQFANRCGGPIEFFICIVRATSSGSAQQACVAIAYRIIRIDPGQSTTLSPSGWPATYDLNECPANTRAVPTPARQQRFCTT